MHPPHEWSDQQGNRFIGFKQAFGQQWQCDPYQQPHCLNEKTHSPKMPDTTNFPNDSSPDTGTNELSSKYADRAKCLFLFISCSFLQEICEPIHYALVLVCIRHDRYHLFASFASGSMQPRNLKVEQES